jgi:mRNA interferase MazF
MPDYRARQAIFITECRENVIEEVLRRIQPILWENVTVDE